LLINRSAINDDDTSHTTPLKKFNAKHVIDYWALPDVHYLATMLHPNLKSFNHTPDKKLYAESLLKIAFNKLPLLDTNVQDETKTKDGKKLVNPIPKTLIDPLDEIFDKPMVKDNLVKPASSKTELDLYLCDETKIEKETNIFNYWKLNETQYPILAQLAKQILCIPAINTAIERLKSCTCYGEKLLISSYFNPFFVTVDF
ncbi:unnamed protein product, partial [Didymodactylos carnosus]